MSDPALALGVRSGLPDEMRPFLAEVPRERWGSLALPETARFWLQMHEGFRHEHQRMAGLVGQWRSGSMDAAMLHGQLIPVVQGFLQHLDGHHRVESGHYFPQFRRIEPRVAAGIDLLDRDHDAVHAALEGMFEAARDFHVARMGGAGDVGDRAAVLGERIDAMGPSLIRHLDDEEEIIIPLIALRGG